MSSVYECVDCRQNYCVDCDGGEDSCAHCHTGPRCHECAREHEEEHNLDENEERT